MFNPYLFGAETLVSVSRACKILLAIAAAVGLFLAIFNPHHSRAGGLITIIAVVAIVLIALIGMVGTSYDASSRGTDASINVREHIRRYILIAAVGVLVIAVCGVLLAHVIHH